MNVDHEVIVVGAGPAGLLVAAELTRLGVDVAILERRSESGAGTRAIGVHGPALAALEPSGATERILRDAARISRGVARTRRRRLGEVRLGGTHPRFPFVASVPQAVTEAALAAGAPLPDRGVEVVSVSVLPNDVVVTARRGAGEIEVRARAVVIAAGASGRGLALPFADARAHAYPDRYLMTDLSETGEHPGDTAVITLDRAGVLESFPLAGGGRRLVAWDGHRAPGPMETPEDRGRRLRRAVAERSGDRVLAERIRVADSFGIRRVLLRRMRCGRVFAIGDTAHEVSPIGGQGMNLGLIDAASLAPLLAGWLRGRERTAALDRWEADRLTSARTAARLAGLNTALGRGGSAAASGAKAALVGGALATPLRGLAARAYTMGLDRAARSSPPASREREPDRDPAGG